MTQKKKFVYLIYLFVVHQHKKAKQLGAKSLELKLGLFTFLGSFF